MVGLVLNGGAEHQRCLPGGGGIRRGRSGSSVWRPRAAAAANGPAAPGLPGLPMAPQGLLCHHGGPGGSRWHRRGPPSQCHTAAACCHKVTSEVPPQSTRHHHRATTESPPSPCCHPRATATKKPLQRCHYRQRGAITDFKSPLASQSCHKGTTITGPPSRPQRHHCHNRAATATIGSPQSHHCHRTTTEPLAEAAATTKLSPASASQGCQPLGLFTVEFMYP